MSRPPGPWDDPPERRTRSRSPLFWWLAAVAALLALVALLAWRFPAALSFAGGKGRLVYLVALASLVSGALLARRDLSLGRSAKHALAWIAVALVLVGGYGFRFELLRAGERILGELMPARGIERAGGTVAFRAGTGGHFRVEALVNGTPVRFLVDTGASDVVLRPADARRLGFDPSRLVFDRVYSTANGTVRGAPIRLDEIVIGPIRITGLPASVNAAPMETSLLGMRFLERLGAYEVRDGTLTLYR